jgi:hypothetical protein
MLYDPDSRHVTNLFRTVNEPENGSYPFHDDD